MSFAVSKIIRAIEEASRASPKVIPLSEWTDVSMLTPRYTHTVQGNPKLMLEGYFYNKYKTSSGDKVLWRCDQLACYASVSMEQGRIVKVKSHAHQPDWKRWKEKVESGSSLS
ncbi:hypothetical protein LSTR_LSTR000952 [Laodelphax striatellus]|uniref:FLYWCH-type domain-containing protein n=1 Tax=Laodelphax striatellus TaxID=195883 RepID=A0A482X2G8_LAOST|nr:hypothetical protein LSTR_LSTR000952 [Laodelphax striatellus]